MRFTRKTGMQDDEASSDVDPEQGQPESMRSGKSAKSHVDPNAPRPDSVTAGKSAKSRPQQRKAPKRGYLDGQMLIAMPSMGDDRFTRSVIYVCAHSTEGAMGIIVNQPAAHISFADLLVQLDVIPAAEIIQLPRRAGGVKVLKGGPVDTQRGFVLHSSDFFIENSTLPIDEGICLTATLDILKAIARGDGPQSAILALGYAGWAPGQLENEIQHNGWLHCSADPELIFGQDTKGKYEKALKKIGIDLGMLSSEAGHA
jgi:putative transcriptional regulator